MKPSLRSSFSLWTVLVFSALLRGIQADCNQTCTGESIEILEITTTNVTLKEPNCTITTNNNIVGYGSLTSLTPGTVYQITFHCTNCCRNFTTKPETVVNRTASEVTTSSIFVTWIKPSGNSTSYKVYWTDGNIPNNASVLSESINITDLSAGVKYTIMVSAVAEDNFTEGANVSLSVYTKPGKVLYPRLSANTTVISVNWEPPPGEVFLYKVEITEDGSSPPSPILTNKTSTVLSNLCAGTTYNVTITAVAGDNRTVGEPLTVPEATEPGMVGNLSVNSVQTTSVTLTWTKPDCNVEFYKIGWNSGKQTPSNKTTKKTNYTIEDLVPGVLYNITVTASAAKDGKAYFRQALTRPEKPENIMVIDRGTDHIFINWTLKNGKVYHYVVNISNSELSYFKSSNTSDSMANLTNLQPGRLFAITVISVAGNFVNSSNTSFATVPTPPRDIVISDRTTSSLQVDWKIPDMMTDAPDITYSITYQPTGGKLQTQKSTVNRTKLSGLQSGTLYNITITTTGPQNLSSTTAACRDSAYTLPNPVLYLVANPNSTTSIRVNWSLPHDAKQYYQYKVEVHNSTGDAVHTETVSITSHDVSNLQPGSRYNITVSTIVGTEFKSTPEQTFTYTMPKAVTNLTAVYVNTTAIQLIWLRQADYKKTYSYLVKTQSQPGISNVTTDNETATFQSLTPGTLYKFVVSVVVENVYSTEERIEEYTYPANVAGITVIGTTTTLNVSWTKAEGNVSSYSVLLEGMGVVENVTGLNNTTVHYLFGNKTAGVLYCAKVVTTSGPVNTESGKVCNATFPNPPGPITVDNQTVSSINFTWPLPEGMDHNQYNFSVFSKDTDPSNSGVTKNNWFFLKNLQSGSPYEVSIVTVGVLQYESTRVTTKNYTRPYSVINLNQSEITTNSVALKWEQPEHKPTYSFEVQVNGPSVVQPAEIREKSITIQNLQSGSNFNFTVTTLTKDGTQAEPVTVTYFTWPHNITDLEAMTLNTTAVHLRWSKPFEYKEYYKYLVLNDDSDTEITTVTEENVTVSGLNPGTNYTFCITVIAAKDAKSKKRCTSQYTKPERVHPIVFSQGYNNSVMVSWTKPPGNVEYYTLQLNSTSKGSTIARELSANNTSFTFPNLSAGMLYSAVLTAHSGPLNASSDYVTNATFPNAPGPIQILKRTTSSIELRWGEAPLMTGALFHYLLTYTLSDNQSISREQNIPSTNITKTLSSLLSGTSYSIALKTVGQMAFESESVLTDSVNTRPLSVQSLSSATQEKNITVTWTKPDYYKETYRYNLTWEGDEQSNSITISGKTEYVMSDLTPGSQFNISVTTETSDGTQAAPQRIYNCTNASPVMDFSCVGPNLTRAEIIVSWTKPSGKSSGFSITADTNGDVTQMNAQCCTQNVSVPKYNTDYIVTVVTQSCGRPSTPVSKSCRTGITYAPIPENYLYLSQVTEKSHDKFTIRVNSSLIDSSNGIVTHVGVLIASRNANDSDDLTAYLGKTYYDSNQGSTPYLATVKEYKTEKRSSQGSLSFEIGDGSKWESYTNGPLKPSNSYKYAIVMFTVLKMNQNHVNVKESVSSPTPFFQIIVLNKDPANNAVAIGVPLGIFAILFIVLMGFIIYWKRLSKKETSDIHIQSMSARVSAAVRVEDYEAYYRKQKADSNCGFAEEFEDLKLVGTGQSKIHALSVENKPKNRYNNVLPYDSSRVKLSIIHGSPYDDYINANYMPGYLSRKEFIAAQGPLPATVNEFWRMIWEKNVHTLVMLTRCNEQGRVKCEQYWDSGTKHFEDITVTTTSEIPLDDWTIREFDIKNVRTAEVRSVRHFHFTAWPDHGVPETTELLISFRHLVREHMNQYSRHSPTVVHCSAGVGRTGTFIAIDRLIFQIERENMVDVYGIVYDLRMHRPLMVQTEDQYVFLNQCALDVIRSRTGTNVDLIYQNTAALSIYENVEPKKRVS